MPQVDPTFIVGAIREKEKHFLEADEYTRLIGAPSLDEAFRVLVDTPYGVWLQEELSLPTVYDSLRSHLKEELTWLFDLLDDPRVKLFLSARYDALNIAHALIEFASNKDTLTLLTPLGAITQDTLFTTVWKDEHWDALPEEWREIIQTERNTIITEGWTKSQLFSRMESHVVSVMENVAFTPLMKRMTKVIRDQYAAERALRTELPKKEVTEDDPITKSPLVSLTDASSVDEMERIFTEAGYTRFTKEMLEEISSGSGSLMYERAWDEEVMDILHTFRLEPTGYDPVISYWFGKESEVKMLRILFSAKSSGLPKEQIEALRRPYYQYSTV